MKFESQINNKYIYFSVKCVLSWSVNSKRSSSLGGEVAWVDLMASRAVFLPLSQGVSCKQIKPGHHCGSCSRVTGAPHWVVRMLVAGR